MPRVKIKYLSVYFSITHKKEEYIEFEDRLTLGELLDRLARSYKPKFKESILNAENNLKPHAWILINKKRTKNLQRELKDGEVVVFSLPIVGG